LQRGQNPPNPLYERALGGFWLSASTFLPEVKIVDASGNMEPFAKMDNAWVFTRRHSVRKVYTPAILGINSGDWG